MTLLSQLGLWATGSDLNKNLKKLRLIITYSAFLLFGLLLLLNTFASIYYTKQALERRRPINIRMEQSNIVISQLELERRQLELERRNEYIEQQFEVTVFTNIILLLILTCSTYMLLYPLLKPIQIESENREKFLSYASHELRTPLAVIFSNLSLAKSTPLITKTLEEILKLQNLSNRILNGYQNQNLTKNIKSEYNAKELIEEIITDLEPINTKNIKINIHNNSNFITNNYIELYQIIYNIITNIYYYSTSESESNIIIEIKTIKVTNNTKDQDFIKGVGIEIMEQEAKRINMTISTSLVDHIFCTIISKN